MYLWCLNTVYMVILAVVLFSQISRVSPRKTFHFDIYVAIYSNENITNIAKITLLQISPPSPKSRKYLYAKYMAHTVP